MENKLLIIKLLNKEIRNKNTSIRRKCDLYRMRAILNLEIKKYSFAIKDSDKILFFLDLLKTKKIYPNLSKKINKQFEARIYLIRGVAHFRKGNKNNGTNDFIKAIEIYPRIIKERTYLVDELPNGIKSTFKYLSALN